MYEQYIKHQTPTEIVFANESLSPTVQVGLIAPNAPTILRDPIENNNLNMAKALQSNIREKMKEKKISCNVKTVRMGVAKVLTELSVK